jgi:hypothetical protein
MISMTKRSVENSINRLNEDLLGDLSAAERRTLTLEAYADGRYEHVEQLQSTCPTYSYSLPDLTYYLQIQSLHSIAINALYDLHTFLLQYHRTMTRNRHRVQIEALLHECDKDGGLPTLDPSDQPTAWAGRLIGAYRGYERFATDDLEVPLETWFAMDNRGSLVIEATQAVIDEYERGRSIEECIEDMPEVDPPEVHADRTYQVVHSMWSALT